MPRMHEKDTRVPEDSRTSLGEKVFGYGIAAIVMVAGTWIFGALALFLVGSFLAPDLVSGDIHPVWAFLAGVPVVLLLVIAFVAVLYFISPPDSADEQGLRIEREFERRYPKPDNEAYLNTMISVYRHESDQRRASNQVLDPKSDPSTQLRHETLAAPTEVESQFVDKHNSAAWEYSEEVWQKLWNRHGTEPFETNDVEETGNTLEEANHVLVMLQERGVLKTVGLRSFQLLQPPPEG